MIKFNAKKMIKYNIRRTKSRYTYKIPKTLKNIKCYRVHDEFFFELNPTTHYIRHTNTFYSGWGKLCGIRVQKDKQFNGANRLWFDNEWECGFRYIHGPIFEYENTEKKYFILEHMNYKKYLKGYYRLARVVV